MSPIGSRVYLLGYNGIQLIGWSYTLSLYFVESFKTSQWTSCSQNVEILLRIVQTIATLEILHAYIGLVKTSFVTTAMQIFSRLLVVWGVLFIVPEIQGRTIGVPLTIVSWCLAEMVRYMFYILTLCRTNIQLVTWARYSFFSVLYPTGITGEVLLIFYAIRHLRNTETYSYKLPNQCNCDLSLWIVLTMILISYIPASRIMFMHMLKQRMKALFRKD